MKRIAILVALFVGTGIAAPLIPLTTTPDSALYSSVVIELIDTADTEVLACLSDVRIYAGNGATDGLLAALAEAAGRGVRVRILAERREEGPYPEQKAALAYLEERGVAVRWDTPEVTLHTKFLVIDRRWVIVGSTHWTMSALTRSVQLDLAIEAEDLGDAFGRFFDFLWEGQLQVTPQLASQPWPRPAVVPLLDPPRGGLHAQVIPEMLQAATESIHVWIYRLAYYPAYSDSPSNRIVDALCRAASRGIEVQVLLEGGEDFADLARDNRIVAAYLSACGVAVRFDEPGTTLHAKGLLVDRRDALITSANWSYFSLVHNVEAGVAVLGIPELVQPLAEWFDTLWIRARPLR